MRKAWITTIAAGISAAGMIGDAVQASPAGMARPNQTKVNAVVPSTAPAVATAVPPVEAAEVASETTWHPFKFFASNPAPNPAPPVALAEGPAAAAPTQPMAAAPEQSIATAQECERRGEIQQARQHYHQAMMLWPGHVDVLRAAARMEDRMGEMPLAESLYRQAVAANPQHSGALNDLGLCLARQGKLDASVQVIEQAIHLQPDKPLYRNNVATVLVELRQDQKALAHLAAVHAPAEANYNFGQLLVQRGRGSDAAPYFQAAVEQNPGLQPARLALAKLQGREASDMATNPVPSGSPNNWPTTAAPQSVTPPYAPQEGPQLTYPSAAWSPPATAAPPTYQPPAVPYTATHQPAYPGTAPRYLPPVATQPGNPRR